jgi:prepilin-type N-terminal cleavage/methylation domain-containing protein
MNRVAKQKGFTLIELVLAMAFVAALFLAIAMTVIQIANIYNRGLTLKEVNQAGRSISSELQRSISSGASFTIDPSVGDDYVHIKVISYYIPQTFGGRLCVGKYSYIWNYGADLANYPNISKDSNLNVYFDKEKTPIRFVKVFDPTSNYCANIADGSATGGKYITSHTTDSYDAIEMLNIGEHGLVIQSFKVLSTVSSKDAKTGQQLYSIEFVVGTNNQDALDFTSGPEISCKSPEKTGSDPLYCAVNRFNITARSGSKSNDK